MPIEVPVKYAANVPALKNDGTSPNAATPYSGFTLANSTTYLFPLGGEKLIGVGWVAGAQIQWDAAVVATITLETCQFASKTGAPDPVGPADISDFDTATKGGWMKQDPASAYITVTSSDGTTGGATVTNGTVAVAGGTAGAADYQVGNLAARRMRLKVVVTTGGIVRCGMFAKGA